MGGVRIRHQTRPLGFKTNLTDVYSNTVSVIFVTKLVKEMEKNRTNILIFSRKNHPISSSNSSHYVFRGQIRTLTSSQSELPLRPRGEYRDHYRDILLSWHLSVKNPNLTT